ncbi:predicted GPI-anchored protein 58 [Pseudomyrmex gracilis]|uniref:predicted GPI-anchored protein 58 n=1 Tax=Pseudomyrmex gracilis TaxID=219809 RepID=UPI00099522A3|nr:predicted GPI-anchored protein 58 [Pseudomyrmex gracilis]
MDISPPPSTARERSKEATAPLPDTGTQRDEEHPAVKPVELKDIESLLKAHRKETDRQMAEKLSVFYEQVVHCLSIRPPLRGQPQGRTDVDATAEAGCSGLAATSAANSPAPPSSAPATSAEPSTGLRKKKKKKRKSKKRDGGGSGPGDKEAAKAASQAPKPALPASLPSSSQPSAPSTSKDTWSQVVERKKRKQKPAPQTPASAKSGGTRGGKGPTKPGAGAAKATPPKLKLGRPPRSAAVVLSAPERAAEGFLAEVLKYVRERVSLEPLGIQSNPKGP